MLSTLTIISIFMEIFACGILLGAAYSFFSRFLRNRLPLSLSLSLFFFLFSIYIGLTLVSQMMFSLDRSLSELIFIHKIIAVSFVISSFLVWIVARIKFNLGKNAFVRLATYLLALLVILFVFRISFSTANLVYRYNVIEPVVNFSLPVPVKSLWVVFWSVFALLSLVGSFRGQGGAKRVLFLSFSAAIFILLAELGKYFYTTTTDSTYLLASWSLILFSAVFLVMGESIPEESEIALAPFNFFRTRILFKLILIFVLLIVILLEATTLATININRMALSQSVKNSFLEAAGSLADKIEYAALTSRGKLDFAKVQKLVSDVTIGEKYAYVVGGDGKIIAHSDVIRAKLREDAGGIAPVVEAMKGNKGALEFIDAIGEEKVAAYVPVKRFDLAVIIEEPIRYAYAGIRRLEINTLLFVITGIILTVLVGIFFARSIEKPIRDVINGTEAVRKGDLDNKIKVDSLDEIGKLAEAFNLMTSDLKDSQEHLVTSEKLASLGTMAAGMAHEIKNPLVSLRTFSQLLQQKFDDPEYRKKFSAIVPQEIERINRIAESLLKFGRPSKPELIKVNVNKILEEVIELFENECRRYDIRITTKFATLPEIIGDSSQLRQAFVNIVLNAIQAMSGGGELIIKTDVGEVIRIKPAKPHGFFRKSEEYEDVSSDEGKAFVKEAKPIPVVFIEITDTGPGIEEESLKSLFDPFFTTKMSGTGMGLPITLRVIEEHGGSIKVRSHVGKGTTFIITLPQRIEKG